MNVLRAALWMAITVGMLPCVGVGLAAAQFPAGGTNVVGAALALPVDLRDARETEIVITNAGEAVTLHVILINGGPDDETDDETIGDTWDAEDFDCDVTPNETTIFRFHRNGMGQRRLTYECSSDFDANDPRSFTRALDLERGIMFVAIENNVSGFTSLANQIFGDATVIDFSQGLAYSFDAISFRGMAMTGPENFNREYQFDNVEYSAFPSKLATNFIAPTLSFFGQDGITAELILFTLDGTLGSGVASNVLLAVDFYDDDEIHYSDTHRFECFDIVDLLDISPSFDAQNLGSAAGHLVLTPKTTTFADIAHDVLFDGGAGSRPGLRKAPVHGWLVQTVAAGTTLMGSDPWDPILAGNAAWGRPLASSLQALTPDTGDVPTLNAFCSVAPCP
jgi:hypothetical protein